MRARPDRVLDRHLEPDEALVWSGQPRQGPILRPVDGFLIPFSLLWGGFAIVWEVIAITTGTWPFALFGIPFVLVGLYLIFGRFLVDAKMRARTLYGLTDRRILIVSGLLSITTTSLSLETLHDVMVKERKNGSGSILFGRPHPFALWYSGMPMPGMAAYLTPGFEDIGDVRRIHERILEARRTA